MFPEDLTHPEDRPSHTIYTTALLKGERDQSVLEKRYIRKDGAIIWVQVESALIRHSDGRPYCTIAVILDITARRQSEEVGRRQAAQFETLLNQAPLGVYLVDADFRITQVNPVARPVFGDIPDLIGRDFREVKRLLWNPAHADEIVAIFHHTLDTGESYVCPEQAEARIDRGVTEYYEWRVDRITLPDGRYGLVCYFRDISAQLLARQTIAEHAQALERLNAELEVRVGERTRALVASQEHLRAMATELNLAEQRERRRLAEILHDHLQQMLVLGKLKVGQGQRLVEAVPACADLMTQVDEILTDALTFTRTLVTELSPPVLHEHGLIAGLEWLADYMRKHDLSVTLRVSPDKNIQLSEGHSILLFQSVREILINSAKHGGTGRAIVEVEHRADQLHITVSDKGKGFDPDMIKAAAAVDELSNPETSTKFGLFSIRERMKDLGGSFDLKTAPGKGTTIRLTLPLSRPAERQAGASDPLTNLPDTPTSPSSELPIDHLLHEPSHRPEVVRLLLVDDHAMVRQGLRVILESYPDIQVVGEARDGQEAVEMTQQLEPSVVVMDINMPRMNGIEATSRITSSHPHTVVIGLSVNADGENQTAMKKAGAAILLTKDDAVQHLYTAIQDSLQAMRARKTDEGLSLASS